MKDTKLKFTELPTAEDNNSVWIQESEPTVGSYVYCSKPIMMLIDGKTSETRNVYWDNSVELRDGNILVMEDGKILAITKKEATVPAETPEETPIETKKEEMENKNITLAEGEIPAETPAASDAPVESTPEDKKEETSQDVMSLVKPMFDEVYKKIAELQTMIETMGATEETDETELKKDTKLSSVSSLTAFINDMKKK